MRLPKCLWLMLCLLITAGAYTQENVHLWDVVEITLTAEKTYGNAYMEVDIWVQLQGPGFDKKMWGFWDGGDTFRIRVAAAEPGTWTWTSFATDTNGVSVNDPGMEGKTGSFTAVAWTEAEKQENINRRGIITATPNGRAFMHADGSPFFLIADTWWCGFTQRMPFKGIDLPQDFLSDWDAGQNMSFEGAIQEFKKLGYNSNASTIMQPNWTDEGPSVLDDDAGVHIRDWKANPLRDEDGNTPFLFPGKCVGDAVMKSKCADMDRISPAYWKSADRKFNYMHDNGFIPYVETFRRDQLEYWMSYYDFGQSFGRFLGYMHARYQAHSFIYSLTHCDLIGVNDQNWPKGFTYYYDKYGKMPYGQPVTAMYGVSTSRNMEKTDTRWKTANTSGNVGKSHTMEQHMADQWNNVWAKPDEPDMPVFANEPYYVCFNASFNSPDGATVPECNGPLDTYWARSHMWGSVLNGGLPGHINGSGARWNPLWTPHGQSNIGTWELLKFDYPQQVRHIRNFVLAQGVRYWDLTLASDALPDRKNPAYGDKTLEGWVHMMRTTDKKFALLYCEAAAPRQTITGMLPDAGYMGSWFNPRTGETISMGADSLRAGADGVLELPDYPPSSTHEESDWAVTLINGESDLPVVLRPASAGAFPGMDVKVSGNRVFINSDAEHRVVLELLDISGKQVKQLFNGNVTSGGKSFMLEGSGLPQGVCFLRVQTEAGAAFHTFVSMKGQE